MKDDFDVKSISEQYLMEILTTKDINVVRNTLFEMIVMVGSMYRRVQIHMFLHPFFFLAGFLSCFFLN
tara:strand:+ start:689 stop:892 length:204 start_codon:yes stop_codon:yes gene_type:complete